MTSPSPVSPNVKTSTQNNEVAIATSISDVNRFFQPLRFKMSRQSPPVLNIDVTEGTLVFDKTTLRLYTVLDQTLRFVQFT